MGDLFSNALDLAVLEGVTALDGVLEFLLLLASTGSE